MKGKKAKKTARTAGMTLLEVVLAFGVLVLLFSAYAAFIGQANTLNAEALTTDVLLQTASAALETESGTPTPADITYASRGGVNYSVDIDVYTVSEGDVTLKGFKPRP